MSAEVSFTADEAVLNMLELSAHATARESMMRVTCLPGVFKGTTYLRTFENDYSERRIGIH